jgi:hypothetical protein
MELKLNNKLYDRKKLHRGSPCASENTFPSRSDLGRVNPHYGLFYASLITTITHEALYLFHSKSTIPYFVGFFLPLLTFSTIFLIVLLNRIEIYKICHFQSMGLSLILFHPSSWDSIRSTVISSK